MSILSVLKKAVTEAEKTALCEQTLSLADPFGIPTGFIDIDDISAHPDIRDEKDLIDIVATKVEPLAAQTGVSEEAARPFIAKMTYGLCDQLSIEAYGARASPAQSSEFDSFADTFNRDTYPNPRFGIVITPTKEYTVERYISELFGISRPDSFSLPTSPAELRFFTTWHEIGHITGAGEAQTQLIAATMLARCMENTTALKVEADWRALLAPFITNHSDDPQTKAGWAMAEAVDIIRATPRATLDALSEEQIRDFRFVRFNDQSTACRTIGTLMKENAKSLAEPPKDLLDLAQKATERALKTQSCNFDNTEKRVLARFHLAATRLSIGTPAYQDLDPIDCGQSRWLTLEPEAVPECLRPA